MCVRLGSKRKRTGTVHPLSAGSRHSFGHRVRGSTVEFFVSKTLFHGADRVAWDADAVWWAREQFDHLDEVGTARMDQTDLDLGALAGTVNGETCSRCSTTRWFRSP